MLNLVGWTGTTANTSTSSRRYLERDDNHDHHSCQPPARDEHRLSTQSATSLTSSRPAPPSPAISRRASDQSRCSSSARSRPPSGTSGAASRPSSGVIGTGSLAPAGALSRTPSVRRSKDILGMPVVAESKEVVEPPTEVLIRIRDYAFPSSDPRFAGDGPYAPRPNRPNVLARKLRQRTDSSTPSTASSTTSSEDNDQAGWEDEPSGWGGFRWSLGRGWGMPMKTMGNSMPSQSESNRNFTDDPEVYVDEDEGEEDEESEYVDAEEDLSERDDDGEAELDNILLPGIYRAMYPFEPEGTAEMKLEEEQMVRVIGRGGGVGWAVVVKEGLRDNGVHALVPESYLELVKLDSDEDAKDV
ncbi:hypothetical protein V8B97DRAFT_978821 [Scleroderma yunnanense]